LFQDTKILPMLCKSTCSSSGVVNCSCRLLNLISKMGFEILDLYQVNDKFKSSLKTSLSQRPIL
jgi:hypothetical protein